MYQKTVENTTLKDGEREEDIGRERLESVISYVRTMFAESN